MGKETFDVARIASPDDVADALRAIAAGLRRGEVSLESAKRTLRLETASEMKLELTVKSQGSKGKIAIEIGWKRRSGAKAADLRLEVGHRPMGSA